MAASGNKYLDLFSDHSFGFPFGPKKGSRYPLHFPSSYKSLREALERGSDPNEFNEEDNAPIHCLVMRKAKREKHRKEKMHLLVTLLTFGDVEVDKLNGEGHTAMHIAVKTGDTQIIKILITFGADIDCFNSDGQSPYNLLLTPLFSWAYTLARGQRPMLCPIAGNMTDGPSDSVPDSPADQSSAPGNSHQPSNRLRRLDSLLAIGVGQSPSHHISDTRKQKRISSLLAIGVDKNSAMALSPSVVDQVSKILVSAGAEEKPSRERALVRATLKASRAWRRRKRRYERPEAIEIRYKYYYYLRRILLTRFSNVADHHLSEAPGDSAYLLEHMKEIRLLQMAGSRVLFLDGGGLKTVMQVEILAQLEERTGRCVTELFDWIVGTSAGGLIALGLVYGNKTLPQLRQLTFRLREDVFMDPQGGISFNSDGLETILKELFGDMKMCDVQHPKVIVPATYKKTVNLKLHLFSNVFDDDLKNEYVWKVARYTTSAPIFFTELDHYTDGGVLAQNPSLAGITAIEKHFIKNGQIMPVSIIVSLGCGKVPDELIGDTNLSDVLYFGKGWLRAVGHLTDRIKSIGTLLSNAITESEVVAENTRFLSEAHGTCYYRFNPELDKVISATETDLTMLTDMIMKARFYIVRSMEFQKLVLSFEKVAACRKLLAPSYSEKLQKLLSSYKTDLQTH